MPLKKPMLVLKKLKLSTEEEKGDINSTKVELDVIGVIRQRILFKTRPKALISSKTSYFFVYPELTHLLYLITRLLECIEM